MGNSSSQSPHGHHHGHFPPPSHFQQHPGHPGQKGWFHSLEHPGQDPYARNNRMKKGYYPPNHPNARAFLPRGATPAQKVLPTAGPPPQLGKLKPTPNGALLHKGGTISGKKWEDEQNTVLKLNKESLRERSSKSPDSDTPNRGSRERSPSYLPIPVQLSPTKKQIIKSKKKYAAPPPPATNSTTYNFSPEVKDGEKVREKSPLQKKNSTDSARSVEKKPPTERLFKTKADQKEEQKLLESERRILQNMTKSAQSLSESSRASKSPSKSPTPKPASHSEQTEKKKDYLPRETPTKSKDGSSSGENSPSAPSPPTSKTFYFGMDASSKNTLAVKGQRKLVQEKLQRATPEKSPAKEDKCKSSALVNGVGSKSSRESSPKEPEVKTIESLSHEGSVSLKGKYAAGPRAEFSDSELSSSSETDIPLLLRPILPQKRPELPRFSPTAAWRSIENELEMDSSPVMGHRSFTSSSAEGSRSGKPKKKSGDGGFHPERSGDSGISAGDGGSPSNPPEGDPGMGEIQLVQLQRARGFRRKENLGGGGGGGGSAKRENSCWTPEQDLDESSSDFEGEDHVPVVPKSSGEKIPPSGLRTPPKLTTRRNLFTRRGYLTTSDSDSGQPKGHLPKHFKKKLTSGANTNGNSGQIAENSSLRRLIYRSNYSQLAQKDSNWFLSKSEPNSLNLLGKGKDLMRNSHLHRGTEDLARMGSPDLVQAKGSPPPPAEGRAYHEDMLRKAFDHKEMEKLEVRSEIGYGPSSMNFYRPQTWYGGPAFDPECEGIGGSQLFSHIMYLPAYDSRRSSNFQKQAAARRAKSVDNLEGFATSDFYYQRGSPIPRGMSQSPVKSKEVKGTKLQRSTPMEKEEMSEKKKKFKFQSTIRVTERLMLEKQLAKEAEEKERLRLREIEVMRRVEEEFQRKRAREKREEQLQKEHEGQREVKERAVPQRINVQVERKPHQVERKPEKLEEKPKNVPQKQMNGHIQVAEVHRVQMSQRQEPEGAPAQISPVNDLRSEIMKASKKRNGFTQSGNSTEILHTQELSEYRVEPSRQYKDYRRSPGRGWQEAGAEPLRKQKGSKWSEHSSQIPPQGRYRSTVHPEVICDIPLKPYPYLVNFSNRLSSSSANLLMDDRPSSGASFGAPSSVISDNYRRDWAHHGRGPGSGLGMRASSIASLHSTELLNDSPGLHKRKSPLYHKYSSSPPSSPIPASSNSNSAHSGHSSGDPEKDSSTRSNHQRNHLMNKSTIMIGDMGPTSGVFQPQPFRAKGYRPVQFIPGNNPGRFHKVL